MSKLVIVVPVARRAEGRAVLLAEDGRTILAPFAVLAIADARAAARHGNPGRASRRPFGDTPTGSYVVAGALPPALGRRSGKRRGVGAMGALVLSPVGGDALEAMRAGRTRF